ncbi:uncharacterized protein Dere_GG27186 [Drosophila erecta]|uniref:Uncharacterized protein n=1 Tax=Drosophila erecta TaxID=7220 RepID=A0A0Q5VU81_DROER|nr:uncharacterized protein Dere_GG27186 [Drosophila erecta]
MLNLQPKKVALRVIVIDGALQDSRIGRTV